MDASVIAQMVMDQVINDLKYAFDIDQNLAEKVACTVIRNPQMAVELEQAVKSKRALGL